MLQSRTQSTQTRHGTQGAVVRQGQGAHGFPSGVPGHHQRGAQGEDGGAQAVSTPSGGRPIAIAPPGATLVLAISPLHLPAAVGAARSRNLSMAGSGAVCPLQTPLPHSLAEEARPDEPRQELK